MQISVSIFLWQYSLKPKESIHDFFELDYAHFAEMKIIGLNFGTF